ncbi:MAG: membrane protein insertion efficiency factor YidD [Candidatus Kerfeldbacteria bacterium]|nr:membrane protein insertion efficiency factor YidD [Candidatus Kerfeldbacteria bacterium]
MRRFLIACIHLYQRTLSPDHGPLRHLFPFLGCRYYPSCSVYTIHAIERYGVVRGVLKGGWRVLRCNPFSQGGHDPLY